MSEASAPRSIAVVGNPNVGKTTLFNQLTGSRYRVGNYPGVTVERRSGAVVGAPELEVVDLPGCYSLSPYSEDEAVALATLLEQDAAGEASCGAVLVVLDATNLARNLYLLSQLLELGRPLVVALNMADEAKRRGMAVDAEALSRVLGVPVVETVARDAVGLEPLREALRAAVNVRGREPRLVACDATWLRVASEARGIGEDLRAQAELRRELMELATREIEGRSQATQEQRDAAHALVQARYAWVQERLDALGQSGPTKPSERGPTRTERIDRWLTHRVAGPLIFLLVMTAVFQGLFAWSDPAIGAIEDLFGALSAATESLLGPGLLTDLLTQGLIAGVGNVVVFLPQIALLFLLVGLLEDCGYMARAAFIIDRLMAKVGLEGRAFVPLLSGYACAIPAIMGTRTLRDPRDRVLTILMIPFMSCSARLPIYSLVIGALFAAHEPFFGPISVGAALLLSMYLLSTVSALAVGALYRRTILPGPAPTMVLELPPYRLPRARDVVRQVFDRSMDFLRDAGTIILAATVVLWGLLSFPQLPDEGPALDALVADKGGQTPTPIEHSLGGRLGQAMEPVLAPIGQDWRMGIGLIGSFAAREVLVSTLGLVHGIEEADEEDRDLRASLNRPPDPSNGDPGYGKANGIALMVFFVYACQCMSTLAVVRRETQSWKWPIFMFVSMSVIAYLAAALSFGLAKMLL